MRVRVAVIRPFADRQWGDAFGHDRRRHLLDVLEEALEPAFQVHAVPQDQIGVLRLDDVARGRLIVVDPAPGLVMDSTTAASPATFWAMS